MTNSEYFEKNETSFTGAMEIFNTQKNKKGGTKSFDKFLASEHAELKFKVGDLIVLQLDNVTRACGWHHQVVFEVIAIDEKDAFPYELKALTPNKSRYIVEIGCVDWYAQGFIEDHCNLY